MAAITQRNGRYKVIYNYVDEDGNRKQKWETYQTLPEAKNMISLFFYLIPYSLKIRTLLYKRK